MRQLFSTIALIVLALTGVQAQQEAHYTQFMYNNLLINPAFAGSRDVQSVMALYRNQWLGFTGNPQSYLVGFDMPIPKARLGAGMTLARQGEGITNRNFANLALNYAIIQSDKMSLRIGLNGTIKHYRYGLQDPSVNIKNTDDDYLSQDNPSFVKSNIGFGAYFDKKSFYVGVSVPNLIKNAIQLNKQQPINPEGTEQRHVYIQAGGFFRLNSDNLHLRPALMVKYVRNAPISADLNMSIMFNRQFLIGSSLRMNNSKYKGNDSADLLAFYQVTKEMGIGAAYDFTLSEIKNYSNGSIEVLLRYDFMKNKNILNNPRFFF
jgi:type IX secretion system PorP/SprF family membrane protein